MFWVREQGGHRGLLGGFGARKEHEADVGHLLVRGRDMPHCFRRFSTEAGRPTSDPIFFRQASKQDMDPVTRCFWQTSKPNSIHVARNFLIGEDAGHRVFVLEILVRKQDMKYIFQGFGAEAGHEMYPL